MARRRAAGSVTGVILPGRSALEPVAGIALASRAAVLFLRAGADRPRVVGDPSIASAVSRGHGSRPPVAALEGWPVSGRVLVAAGDVVFDLALLESLLGRASAIAIAPRGGAFVLAADAEVARLLVEASGRGELARAVAEAKVPVLPETAGLVLDASSPAARAEATAAVLARTRKAVDGPHRRLFERRISRAISRRLLPLPISPSLVTAVSLALGLLAATLLSTPRYVDRLGGAILLVLATILDGCDGELARAKLLESRAGALFDTTADIVTAMAVLYGICAGVGAELGPGSDVQAATALLLIGVALAAAAILATGGAAASPCRERTFGSWLDALDNRGWTYLVLLFAATDALPWFVFCAGVGAHVFAFAYVASRVRLTWRAS